MESWINAVAARSGPLLTAATQFTTSHGVERDPPRGVGGLHTLSALIAQARHHHPVGAGARARANAADAEHEAADDDANEREFVAGAGAYLGLLLLDHLPHGAHVANAGEHRLRLGAYGFFDPFAAVVSALSAEDTPRALRALIDAVKCAEDEAAGRGPIARVVRTLRHALEERPQLRLVEHFDHRVWLDVAGSRTEIDLSHLIEANAHSSDALLQHAIDQLCASLLEGAAPVLAWEAAREIVVPRLVGPSFLRSVPDADALHLVQRFPHVWETLVLRFDERSQRSRFVRKVEFEAWTAANATPRIQAIRNLARASQNARFVEHETVHGPLVVAQTRDGLDAARLLLPGLHDVVAGTLGSPFVAAIPHRDTLLAASLHPAALVADLRSRAQAAARSAPHAISSRLWLVSGPGQWIPYADRDYAD